MALSLPKIGDIEFAIMDGSLKYPRKPVEITERKGTDGSRATIPGLREQSSEIQTVQTYATASEADTAMRAMEAISSTVVSIIDQKGITRNNVLVEDCEPQSQPCLDPSTNPAHTQMVITRWKLRKRVDV